MTNFGNIDMRPPDDDYEPSRPVGPMVGVALVVIVLIGLAVYWFTRAPEEEAAPEPPPQAARTPPPPPPPAPPPEPVDPEPVGLPLLDESDELVRELLVTLSSHPGLAEWLVTDGLIRRLVVAVDNVADGRNPAQHVPFMRPVERFAVSGDEPSLRVDARSYGRYDSVAQIVASLDTAGSAELFRRLEPLMDQAYRDLGYPDTRFRTTLARAIEHLLEVPIPEDPPEVFQGAAFYEYIDERFDSLSPVQKQLLVMGPDNVQAVHNKLRAIAAAIGLNVR